LIDGGAVSKKPERAAASIPIGYREEAIKSQLFNTRAWAVIATIAALALGVLYLQAWSAKAELDQQRATLQQQYDEVSGALGGYQDDVVVLAAEADISKPTCYELRMVYTMAQIPACMDRVTEIAESEALP
jgi:hypothetical protein